MHAEQTLTHHPKSVRSGKDSAFRNSREQFLAGRMGMFIFLASLAVLFLAGLVGYVVIRLQLPWPANLPPLPWALLLSTLLLAVSSCTLHGALNSIRRNMLQRTAQLMSATMVLGLLFLLMQAVAWTNWFASVGQQWQDSQPYRWALASFYVLTGIHALHVLGGIVPMVIATINALRRRHSAEAHTGIYLTTMYWHFLGIVWVVLYATLLIGT